MRNTKKINIAIIGATGHIAKGTISTLIFLLFQKCRAFSRIAGYLHNLLLRHHVKLLKSLY